MKTIMLTAALGVGIAAAAPAGAQTSPAAQAGMATEASGPVSIGRSEAVAPPGYNPDMRQYDDRTATAVLTQLAAYDYPRCTQDIRDRCLQPGPGIPEPDE